MHSQSFKFVTDTSSICVFDLGSLKHRLNDDADWWCWPPEEQVSELNAGNVAFIDIGGDGGYVASLQFSPLVNPQIEAHLSCPTGRVFIGAAEEVTADGLEPDCTRGGIFLSIPVGNVILQVERGLEEGALRLALLLAVEAATNKFTQPLRLT